MISIIIPFFNEENNLALLYERIVAVLANNPSTSKYEIIFIDDGSTDASFHNVKEIALTQKNVKIVQFKRNYGQTAAMSAGINTSKGKIIIPMDADLQNDPEDIPALLSKLNEGYDVVSGWRKNRKDNFLRTQLSKIANRLISFTSGLKLHDYGCSLKAYKKECFDDLKLYGEIHRFIPLLIYWQGGSIAEIPVKHNPRHSGKSKYGLLRIVKVVLDLITLNFMANYQTKPNYVFGFFGIISAIISLLLFALIAFRIFILHSLDATPVIFLWIFFSISSLYFFLMGIQAEMISRLYFDSDNRKPYNIKSIIN